MNEHLIAHFARIPPHMFLVASIVACLRTSFQAHDFWFQVASEIMGLYRSTYVTYLGIVIVLAK